MQASEDIQALYRDALDSIVARLKQDRNILAAILCGSLSYDEVWAKSDIDLFLIGRDEKKETRDFCLVEHGVNIHAVLLSRGKFKEQIERALQSSFFHSLFSKSTLLFSHDDTIRAYYENVHHVGARDREFQLLRAASQVLPTLAKAEKWLYVKRDPTYSFLWVMYLLDNLASIEVVLHGEVTGREVIHQALRHNPEFFGAAYLDLIHGPKDEAAMEAALRRINGYLDEKVFLLFKPILDYLTEAGGVRSTTEIDAYFRKVAQTGSLAPAYEWLADRDILQKVSAPVRLLETSRITVDEAAYYYDGGSAG